MFRGTKYIGFLTKLKKCSLKKILFSYVLIS